MNLILAILLSMTTPTAQGGGDFALAEDAVEPTIATNRAQLPEDRRVVVAYMKNGTIERVFSTDQGASFRPAARVDTEGQTFDPTLAANLSNGTFYLNYLGGIQGQAAGHWSTTSPDGDIFGNHATLQGWRQFFDRPWLVAAENHVWMSYVDKGAATGFAFFRAGAVSGSTVTWPATGIVWVPDVFPPLSHNPQAIIARGKCNCGLTPHSDEVYGIAVQMHESDRYDPNNKVKIYRSLNAGQNWDLVHSIPLAQLDGSWFYNSSAEATMSNFHIVGENGDNVYAFFTRTEMRIAGRTLKPVSVLYVSRSLDGGDTWSAPIQVMNSPEQYHSPPSGNGYAKVPGPFGPEDGYFRIAQAWSTIAPNGNIHVIWWDNREGRKDPPREPSPERDLWRVRHAKSTDNGATWIETPEPVSGASSLGGFGRPFNAD